MNTDSLIRLDYAAGSAYPIIDEVLNKVALVNKTVSTNINTVTKMAKTVIEQFEALKKAILRKGFNMDEETASKYSVIICSSGSEANSFVINQFDNILCSSVEHDSIRFAVETKTNYKYFNPFMNEDIKTNKKYDLLCLMEQNNETGYYLDHAKYRQYAKYTLMDCVQTFVQRYNKNYIPADFMTFSFHKLAGGITGSGGLVYRKDLGHLLSKSLIHGTSIITGSLRGGTPSVLLLSGAFYTMYHYMNTFNIKQAYENGLRIVKDFHESCERNNIPVIDYYEFSSTKDLNNCIDKKFSSHRAVLIRMLLHKDINTNPFTCLYALVPVNNSFKMCNTMLRKFLEEYNVMVTVSSACKTTSIKSSHVMDAMNVPDCIKRGVHRISFYPNDTDVQKNISNIPVLYNKFIDAKIKFDKRKE